MVRYATARHIHRLIVIVIVSLSGHTYPLFEIFNKMDLSPFYVTTNQTFEKFMKFMNRSNLYIIFSFFLFFSNCFIKYKPFYV